MRLNAIGLVSSAPNPQETIEASRSKGGGLASGVCARARVGKVVAARAADAVRNWRRESGTSIRCVIDFPLPPVAGSAHAAMVRGPLERTADGIVPCEAVTCLAHPQT